MIQENANFIGPTDAKSKLVGGRREVESKYLSVGHGVRRS
jgi:hypothetical protein